VKVWTAIAALVALATGLAAAQGAGAAVRSIPAAVDPAIVDVNVGLAYQGGAAAGTGIVLTSNGEVLTNNHVIRGATSVRVTDVGNGRTYTATVVGYSVSADIAVLQMKNASGLATASIGDSSQVRVGDTVTAIGNAGGQGGTPSVATGAITGVNRSITASDGQGSSEQLNGLLATSAALQPGDSGGPLVDASGHVVGIDTAGSEGFQFEVGGGQGGGGFAIPINRATSLARQIVAGKASAAVHIGPSPLMGVDIRPVGGDGFGFGFDAPQTTAGAVIYEVVPSSPAERAGLAAGDTIIKVNNTLISSPATLTSVLIQKSPGDLVRVTWIDQYGRTYTGTVRLAVGPPQ
jgi:S1-C subfamily serine protease